MLWKHESNGVTYFVQRIISKPDFIWSDLTVYRGCSEFYLVLLLKKTSENHLSHINSCMWRIDTNVLLGYACNNYKVNQTIIICYVLISTLIICFLLVMELTVEHFCEMCQCKDISHKGAFKKLLFLNSTKNTFLMSSLWHFSLFINCKLKWSFKPNWS